MNRGFIKLHRKILKWEWSSEPNTFSVWVHLLLMANHAPQKWNGIDINRGQLVTSVAHLVDKCGISTKKIRNSLERLKRANCITIETTNRYSVITICNYDIYQSAKETNGQTDFNNIGQTKGKQRAANKNERIKEDVTINSKYVPSKNDENIKKEFESLSYEVDTALKNNSVNMSILTLKQYQELRQTNSKSQILGIVYNIINYKRWHSYGSLYGAIKRYIESDIKIDIEDNERGNNGDYPF